MMQVMKDSNVGWMGNIPTDWEVRRTKYCFTVNHGSDPKTDSGNTPVYGSGGNSFKTCEEFKVGPAVLVGRKGTINIPQWIEGNYWNVDTSFDVQPKGNYNLKLYYYVSTCFDYECVATQTALPSMTQFDYLNFKLPFMGIDTQNQIVAYLDAKCDVIDKAIAHKRSVIEKLKEYRTAVITKAVTKGINNIKPTAIRIKYLISSINSGKSLPEEYFDSSNTLYPIFGGGKPIGYSKLFNINNAIIIGRVGANCGCVTCVKGKAWATDNALVLIPKINIDYLAYVLSVTNLRTSDDATAQPLVTGGKIKNTFVLIVNDIYNQQQIVDYLDDKCSKIDTAIQQQEQAIAKLEEYRKSVIYYAVTGKIDCRKAV